MIELPPMQQTPNHSYTVELRFFGDDLKPSEITQRLCLQPIRWSDNLSVGATGRKRYPFWAYNGYGSDGFQAEWSSLEQGMHFLLRQFAFVQETVIELSQRYEGVLWCGHFQTSFDGGPTLSPEILGEIASYRLPLFIDNYFTSESTDNGSE